jgi:hypothetical protein
MATAVNPITGDLIKTKGSSDAYREGYSRIFPERNAGVKDNKTIDPELKEAWGKWCKDNLKKVDILPTFEEWLEKFKDKNGR